jgi:hypothetical protein
MLCNLNLYAQNAYKFELPPVQVKVSNSLYNSLEVIEQRGDTAWMGFIHTGMMDQYKNVKPATPLSGQFKSLFNAVIDSSARGGKLILQITRLVFAEREHSYIDEAFFNMRANLYSKTGPYYQRVASIDTLVIKSAIDPTNKILKSGKEIMTDLIIKNLKVKPSGSIYSYSDLMNISNIEKKAIPLYNTDIYTDGLYMNYHSFKNQMPDRQLIIDSADLNSCEIRTIEGDGITLKVKARNVYAIVYNGNPYVVSEGKYYPLKKIGNDFFFTGKARVSVIPSDELVSDIAGSLAENTIFGMPTHEVEMRIDYKNGVFIHVKVVKDANPGEQNKK